MDSVVDSLEKPATGSAALRGFLVEWASRKIRGFEGTIDEKGEYLSNIYSTAKSISEQIAADYHGRFLMELIQNAYDVHPESRTDGEIEILFDAGASEYGVLYVANRGAPFSERNVKALSDLGLSSKDPGQAIGNKGLGFRSVRHICDVPEIYSQAAGLMGTDWFVGYCFRFANDDDLAALISRPRVLELARKDLPPFHVPVWIEAQPSHVRDYATRGFATVIALPLRDTRAAEAVYAEIKALRGLDVPMLLFLPRLARLNVRVVAVDRIEAEPLCLVRAEAPLPHALAGVSVAGLGPAGRYLIARRLVAETEMIEAITAGIAAKQLHSHWTEWTGDGEVALAVRLDGSSVLSSRLFTYLPMGLQADAPFAGYLHASFFPTANRKGVDGTVRLNAILLQAAADLAAATVAWLTGDGDDESGGLSREDRARAAVDLMCWRTTQSFETSDNLPLRVAQGIATVIGVADFIDAPVAPVLTWDDVAGMKVIWRSPRVARRWTYSGEMFCAAVAARHTDAVGAWPLWPGLGIRTDTLVSYFKSRINPYLEVPTSPERAALAVRVAAKIQTASESSATIWTTYYKELAEFLASDGSALADQLILRGLDGALHPAMSTATAVEDPSRSGRRRFRRTGRVAVFAPPARRGDDGDPSDLSPPNDLAENFAFLAEQLDWYGELADARAFLVRHKLILEFDRESILTQLSRVLRDDTRNTSRAAGLRWAFQIWRRPKGGGRSVSLPASLRLYVPTLGQNFIPAEEAVFSDGWPEEMRGRLIQRLLDTAPADCTDLHDVAKQQLAKSDHYAFRGGTNAQWTEFLTELGVKRGLHPVSRVLSGNHSGLALQGATLWNKLGLSEAAIGAWQAAVAAERPTALASYSSYSISGDLQWMPGQWDISRFDREAIECYALLVIAWLGEALPKTLSLTIRHAHFSQSDVRQWPTPLKMFLREMAWIPGSEPTPNGAQPVVVQPSGMWMAADASERFPSFLRRPTLPVMRAFERASPPQIAAIRENTGLRTFDNPASLMPQAAFLADQFAKSGFDSFYERHLANLYAGTWQRIADHYRIASLPPPEDAPGWLLARRGSTLEVFDLRAEAATGEPIYVRDVDNETAASLVEAANRPMLETRAGDKAQLGGILRALYGDRVRLLSETQYSITIDGREVGTGEMASLPDWCPRLPLMTAVAMEGLKGFDARTLPMHRQIILDRLGQVKLQSGARLGFRLDDLGADELQAGPEALSLVLANGSTVVVVRNDGRGGWNELDRSLSALCDAINHPSLEQGLRILLRSLQAGGASIGDPVADTDLDDLCDSLHLTPRARRAVRETLGAGLERHLPWLRALLYLGGGQAALDAFVLTEAEVVQDPVSLRAAIAPWLAPLACDAQTALDACRTAQSVADLRDTLHLEFEDLNHALVAVGQSPDTYPDIHARQLANRIKAASVEVCDALRAVFAPALALGDPAPAYARARDTAADLPPDPAWAMIWREVPDTALVQHINRWLASHGAAPLDKPHPSLSPLEDTRRANGQTLKTVVGLAAPLVRAWCGAHSVAVPTLWVSPDSGFTELRRRLDQDGVIDFRPLDQEDMLAWIDRLGAWPAEMNRTLDRYALELDDGAIAAARAKEEAEAVARRKQERSIEFNGRSQDPEEVDWTALDAELTTSLSRTFLKTPIGQPAALAAARPRSGPGSRAGTSGSGGGFRSPNAAGRSFAPSAKTEMIGRLGELAVRRWLQARLPKQDIDVAWVSSNAEPFTGRKGDDSLGYDFEISWQRQTWQIEVKSSLNDPRLFQLGETEVRAGRAAARVRSGLQYWIAYVSNLSDPAQARVDLIPNPLGEAGEAVLELVGEGLRYAFRRT